MVNVTLQLAQFKRIIIIHHLLLLHCCRLHLLVLENVCSLGHFVCYYWLKWVWKFFCDCIFYLLICALIWIILTAFCMWLWISLWFLLRNGMLHIYLFFRVSVYVDWAQGLVWFGLGFFLCVILDWRCLLLLRCSWWITSWFASWEFPYTLA